MAGIVTLAEAKLHLRVDQTAEDTIIQLYIDAASSHIWGLLDTPNNPKTKDLQAAALLLIGGMYEQRSDKVVGTIVAENPAFKNLIARHRSLGI